MIAFRIEAGALVGPRMRVDRTPNPPPYPIPTLSPRERRREARQGTRGRREARRVSAVRSWTPVPANRYETFVGHLFGSDVFPDVMLYLPEGEKPTPEHGRMLLEALRRAPGVYPPLASARMPPYRPGMPGSGPIDPEKIWQAVHDGASYSGGLLDGQHITITTQNAWALTSGGGYTLSASAYAALQQGTIRNALIVLATTSCKLAPSAGDVADLAAP